MSDACGCSDEKTGTEEVGEAVGFWQVSEIRAAAVSGVLLVAGWIASLTGGPAWLTLPLEIIALLVAAWTFVPSTLRRLVRGRIGVGTLMTIAAAGAVALGEFEEAAMLAFLYAISEGLEEYSLAKTRRGLRALLDLVPAEATVLRNGAEVTIDPAELVPGDRMVVRPGERLATDGTIITGRTSLDTSALTGESVPVEAGPGNEVFAGSINGTGPLEVEVTSTAENNSLARIVHIVEAEQSRKGPGQRLADSIAKKLVPGILIAAALIIVFGFIVGEPLLWFERALVVLVAASPCALAISVPVTVVASVGAASRIGVLIKGGGALETLGKIRTIALDKTGTLTRNKPAVIDIAATGTATREQVLALAAGLEARSEHPLARAILAAATDRAAVTDVDAVPGAGLEGRLDGRTVRLGRPGWINAGPLSAKVEAMQHAGATAVLIEDDGQVIGAVAVRDELRPEAREVIARLSASGYTTAMLTGDNIITATALGKDAGITEVHADLRPEDKAEIIRTLKTRQPTAMVGDGVNDAPALATADTGIAMGAMGTDVAIETADIALMGEDLNHLPQVLEHARRTRSIMLQNVGLSLALIGVLIPLALFGLLGLAAVVLIHELAEIVVIANGVRAGRTRRDTALKAQPTATLEPAA
ncbi:MULTISPECIES: cation-translocating P-type ATPase [Paenarthrobacter]|jgi:Cd2+/Zn2+-exporting ATPase/cation-transporting ATPase G|uniref:Cation-translocating P-type ATPase n=1 Tax=Paenarthrobacter ureafaciens TaxID=37931 RepID=A0AAX3EQ90_PAEUR|nr:MULTISPECIES: cation-translocating P-type ATPase [Paenarthrobacter]NKR09921.1 ATPase P [Arthrobacter sp. M5]NKR16736.1 ATPase P [Arthrobacter sp. M6]MCW3767336.1 cation-translocating P-type ATPase [Paenarthrobacter sp. PAE-2]MDO5866910.1 cadmium-translocating P-type ATPase [Paenarthrobacter sp. SD-2]MDO5878045.1 cadmium-translocating P-type ATPase [Paenarthrobacter sp. SD-1]